MAALIPRMAPQLFVPGANRTTDFGAFLAERLFPENSPPVYRDLISKWDKLPFIVLHATDMGSGRTFEFIFRGI